MGASCDDGEDGNGGATTARQPVEVDDGVHPAVPRRGQDGRGTPDRVPGSRHPPHVHTVLLEPVEGRDETDPGSDGVGDGRALQVGPAHPLGLGLGHSRIPQLRHQHPGVPGVRGEQLGATGVPLEGGGADPERAARRRQGPRSQVRSAGPARVSPATAESSCTPSLTADACAALPRYDQPPSLRGRWVGASCRRHLSGSSRRHRDELALAGCTVVVAWGVVQPLSLFYAADRSAGGATGAMHTLQSHCVPEAPSP